MLLFASLLGFLGAFVSAEIRQRLGGSEFILVDERVKYSEARPWCHSLGGSLAVPFSYEENDLIIELTLALDEEDVWLGKGSTKFTMEGV